MDGKGRKIVQMGKKNVDIENRVVRFLMSTDEIDREGEVLTKTGWILPDTKRVPMIDSHKWWDGAKHAFAKVDVWLDDEGLWGEAKFASTDLGKDMFTLYAEDVLDQVSVGFLVLERETKDVDGKKVVHVTKKELFELSAVILGANKSAAKKALEDGRIGKKSFNFLEQSEGEVAEMPSGKALDFIAEIHTALKEHRKTFGKMCDELGVEPMQDEGARLKAFSEYVLNMHAKANNKTSGNSAGEKSVVKPKTQLVSGKALQDLVSSAVAA